MSDFLFRELGGTKFNGVLQVEPDGTLYSLDPSHQQLLEWVESVANHELVKLGWDNATVKTCLEGKLPVQYKLNRRPDPQLLKQTGIEFPLLAIWPESEVTEEVTLEREQARTTWKMLWMLGPLNEAEHAKLHAGLRVFSKLVKAMVGNRYHGEHDGGALQFDAGQVEFSSMKFLRAGYGNVEVVGASEARPFYGVEIEFETTETDRYVEGADADWDGIDVIANSTDDEGSWIAAEGRS